MAHQSDVLRYITLDVFTTSRYAGNPLALVLVPPGQDVSIEHMQRAAREFNYSETVFLYELGDADVRIGAEWRMRIFTVDAELSFAGHPTIGTASYVLALLSRGTSAEISARLRCNAGVIDISRKDNDIWASIPHDFHIHDTAKISRQHVLEAQPDLSDTSIRAVDVVSPVKGMTFMVTELASLEALAAVAISGKRPSLELDAGWNKGFVGTAYYVKTAENTYRTRMIEKIFEDPATGSMSCGLATLLAISTLR